MTQHEPSGYRLITVELVGGSVDGQRVLVPEHQRTIYCPDGVQELRMRPAGEVTFADLPLCPNRYDRIDDVSEDGTPLFRYVQG